MSRSLERVAIVGTHGTLALPGCAATLLKSARESGVTLGGKQSVRRAGFRALRRVSLLRLVRFEEASCFFQGEEIAIDGEFVFAGVLRDAVHMVYGVAFAPKRLHEKIEI